MSDCVQTAKIIRKVLKEKFPTVKFQVRSSRYSMGSSVSVRWDDFPMESTVNEIIRPYASVRYDEYSGEILSGGNMFVSGQNTWTKETRAKIEARMQEQYPVDYLEEYFSKLHAFNECAKQIEAEWMEEQETNNKQDNTEQETSKTNESTDNNQATKKQLWALHIASGRTIDTKELNISKQQASDFISRSKQGEDITNELKAILNGEAIIEDQQQAEADVKNYPLIYDNEKPLETVIEEIAAHQENTALTAITADNTSPQEKQPSGKIKVKEITFLWSESPVIEDNTTVTTFKEAEQIIFDIAIHNKSEGYDKTKFLITWEDGHTYEGRIDVMSNDTSGQEFKKHIEDHCLYIAGKKKPSRMTDEDYRNVLTVMEITEEDQKDYIEFLDTYMLTDSEQTPQTTNNNDTPPEAGKVLDLTERIQQRKQQEEYKSMMDHFFNNVLPYMDNTDREKLFAASQADDVENFANTFQNIVIKTTFKQKLQGINKV